MKRLMELVADSSARTGTRIRERRLDQGVRQADLAQEVGISPSYLNLIEHNRRRIGGELLERLAQALGVDPALLTEGADRALLDQMREAASAFDDLHAELDRAEEMAARYPGWAGVIAAQSTKLQQLETRVQMLADRITYDPELATALHSVISAVTSIRATAGILTSDETLDADWLRRFHNNIHSDAVRLAAASDALVAYLDAPEDGGGAAMGPLEELEDILSDTGFHAPRLEKPGASPAGASAAGRALRAPTQALFTAWATGYAADAARLPLAALERALASEGPDPLAVARVCDAPLDLVLRRMACLPADADRPPMGLAICDAGGFLTLRKEVPGFSLPRGVACPLWPLFTALGQPGRVVVAEAVVSGAPETRIACTAIAVQENTCGYDRPPVLRATMLAIPDAPPGPDRPLPVGVSCRICARADCPARREPSALG